MLDRISNEIMLSWGLKRVVIAALAGVLASFALAPFDFFAVLFVAFPILVWLLDGANYDKHRGFVEKMWPIFGIGWAFGFGYFSAGLWWLANTVLVSPEGAVWMLPFALFGLPAVLAVFYGLATMLAQMVWSDNLSRIFALSASFGLFEYLRSFIFTGFPWNVIGYGAMPVPVAMQIVEITGIFGISVFTVFVVSVPALLTTKKGLRSGVMIAGLFVTLQLGYGALVLSQHDQAFSDATVRLVQPSIEQSEKWDDERRDGIFQTHLALTAANNPWNAQKPDIIIWPETSVPYILTKTPTALELIADVLDENQILLAGAVRLEEQIAGQKDQYYNTIYALNGAGQIIASADKAHLVPFGEYLPFDRFARTIGLAPLADSFGGYTAASQQRPIDLPDGLRILALICYEIIFPKYADNSGLKADVIVNVTNDAWYGKTPGPYQHLRQSQIRAIEQGLPLLRAGNNGISVITDNRGRILSGMEIDYFGFLDYEIPVKREFILSEYYRFYFFIAVIFVFSVLSITQRHK